MTCGRPSSCRAAERLRRRQFIRPNNGVGLVSVSAAPPAPDQPFVSKHDTRFRTFLTSGDLDLWTFQLKTCTKLTRALGNFYTHRLTDWRTAQIHNACGQRPEASISARTWGPDPTTFEPCRVHPITGSDQVLVEIC